VRLKDPQQEQQVVYNSTEPAENKKERKQPSLASSELPVESVAEKTLEDLVAYGATCKLGVFKAFQSKTKSVGRSIAQFILANLTQLVPEEQFEKRFTDLLHVAQKPT